MKRILIIFVSKDLERTLFGIRECIKKNVVKVYLLFNKLNNFFGKLSREITHLLEKKLSGIIDCEKVGINPESFEECFEELYKLIEKEKDKKIYVDISSTTKIATAVTFSLASIFNVIPFIVIPEENEKLEKKYIELIKSERNRKGISLYELPIIKHEKILGKKEIVILKILKGKGTTLKGMSKLLKLMKITPTKKELTKLKYILNKMRNKNLIELIKRGREIEIKLTSFGKILAKLIS